MESVKYYSLLSPTFAQNKIMRLLLSLLLSLVLKTAASAQITIKAEDIGKHVGDSVKVCGKVFSTRYFEQAKNSPTLLNIGAAFPNQLLTVVIWGDTRKQFETAPDELFKDKNICITGRVELFKDKPQIVLHTKEQVEIIKE